VINDAQSLNLPPTHPVAGEASASRDVPLCIDLDGTLVRTDCLCEGAIRALFRHPGKLAGICFGSWKGRAWIKRQIGEVCGGINAEVLPFNQEVLALIRREKASGRKVILVTAADQLIAESVATHLNLFDEVIASDGTSNLKGKAKAAALEKRFGRGGFDYAGDSKADIPVWSAGRVAYVVHPSAAVKAWALKHPSATVIGAARGGWRPLLHALRPQHWVKNILIFMPLVTAHLWHEGQTWFRLASFFLALCFGASAVYLINDLADMESDRRHKDKWRRPIASGELPIKDAILAIPLCLALAVVLCGFGGIKALGLLLGYIVATSAYSFYLKRIPVLDILMLSGFYVYRIVAGAVLAPVVLSPWLIAFAMFLFLSLAAAKRYVELTSVISGAKANVARGYLHEDYPMIATFGVNCACLSVLVLGLYVNSDTFRSLYKESTIFWLFCPLLLYWLIRIWILAGRRKLHDDPVVFAIKDRATWVIAALGAVVFYFAVAR